MENRNERVLMFRGESPKKLKSIWINDFAITLLPINSPNNGLIDLDHILSEKIF